MPIHWGIDLKPDSFAPRWVAISMMPGLQLAMLGLMVLLPRLHLPTHGDPRIASWMLGLVLPCAQVLFFVLLRRWRDGTEP